MIGNIMNLEIYNKKHNKKFTFKKIPRPFNPNKPEDYNLDKETFLKAMEKLCGSSKCCQFIEDDTAILNKNTEESINTYTLKMKISFTEYHKNRIKDERL